MYLTHSRDFKYRWNKMRIPPSHQQNLTRAPARPTTPALAGLWPCRPWLCVRRLSSSPSGPQAGRPSHGGAHLPPLHVVWASVVCVSSSSQSPWTTQRRLCLFPSSIAHLSSPMPKTLFCLFNNSWHDWNYLTCEFSVSLTGIISAVRA